MYSQELSIDSQEITLHEGLLGTIGLKVKDSEKALPFPEWCESVFLDGKPFSFKGHEYLIEPYQCDHPYQVEEKAAQLGLTTRAILRVLYKSRYMALRGTLYLFPSRGDAIDFSKSRISTMITDNPDTIGTWISDVDSAGLKKVWNTSLYIRGMRSALGLKSIPVDMIVYDELDEAPQNAVDKAQERMGHSEHKIAHLLSNPTLPDYGINKQFQLTDQKYWLLKCPKCNHYTCMEDTFPDCLIEFKGRTFRACVKCHAELNPAVAQWVAKRPSITEKRGYHYSQLYSLYIKPSDLLHQFRTTTNLQDFHNLKIGNAYVEAENRLSIQDVLDRCGDTGIVGMDSGPCSMGVDQGKDLHVVVGKKPNRIIHVGVYKDWEELDRLMKNFKVAMCVVDALPETRNARAFAGRFEGRVYLNYYNIHQKGSYAWNEKELIVSCNRTESLDASHREVSESILELPKICGITEEFAEHLHNVAKKLEEDEETGSKRYVYVKLGQDHFRHAFNYECIARSNMPGLMFPELS